MLEYDDDKETARYSENVKLLQNDMAIEASRVVTLTLIKGQISEAVAEGAVKVTRGAATGTGEKAVYEAKGEKVTLTGQPASVVDPARGKTEGAMVTMDRSTGNATVTGAPRGQVTTRAVVPK
jgi:lipopolysaccharide transport protein LptA